MPILQQAQAYISDKALLPLVIFGDQALFSFAAIVIVARMSRAKPAVKDPEIERYVPPEQVSGLDEELKKSKQEKAALQNELQNLQAQLEKLKAEQNTKDSLEKENKELRHKADDFSVLVASLNKEIETQQKIIQEQKEKQEQAARPAPVEVTVEGQHQPEELEKKRRRIGEILLEKSFISKDILDKALESQKNTGANITQYLLSGGYINEHQLAQCLCMQFGVPYLPLSSYEIAKEIVALVPLEIAKKYWLVPLEKLGNLLTIVMVDPFDANAIKEVENSTGCRVQAFVGIVSEIVEALTKYYRLDIKGTPSEGKKTLPFFLELENYQGPDRRKFIRFNAHIDVQFCVAGTYIKSKTIDISQEGMQLKAQTPLEIGSYFTVEVNLPQEYSPLPIALLAQAVRVTMLKDSSYSIGVKIVKISRPELQAIIRYASTHQEEEAGVGV